MIYNFYIYIFIYNKYITVISKTMGMQCNKSLGRKGVLKLSLLLTQRIT